MPELEWTEALGTATDWWLSLSKESLRGLCAQWPQQVFRTWLSKGSVSHGMGFSGTVAGVWKGSLEERSEWWPAVTMKQSPELFAKNRVLKHPLRQVKEGWWHPAEKGNEATTSQSPALMLMEQVGLFHIQANLLTPSKKLVVPNDTWLNSWYCMTSLGIQSYIEATCCKMGCG